MTAAASIKSGPAFGPGRQGYDVEFKALGDLHQRRATATATAHRHANSTETEQHHRPRSGLRHCRATRREQECVGGPQRLSIVICARARGYVDRARRARKIKQEE